MPGLDRLYFRVLGRVLVAVAVVTAVFWFAIVPRAARTAAANFLQVMTPAVVSLASSLAEVKARGGDPEKVFARRAPASGVPLALVQRSSLALDAQQASALERGEAVHAGELPGTFVAARVAGTELAVRMGPLGIIHPFGEGRGVLAVILFLAGLMAGVYALLAPIRRRMENLSGAVRRFGEGELGARSAVGPPDAIGVLEKAFNGMTEEIERLINAHQEMLRTVSHELRTPLQRMHFAVANVQEAHDPQASMVRLEKDLDELGDLIDELLTYSRLKDGMPPVTRRVPLQSTLEELCQSLGGMGRTVDLVSGSEVADPVQCDPRLMKRAISNLIVNALRHARSRVQVLAGARDGHLRIEVHDDGEGVAEKDRERVFQPFWRSEDDRSAGRGFGLGLAIVRQIAERHGGHVDVAKSPALGGACFRFTLPAV